MIRKLLFISCLLLCSFTYAQKNEIKIFPESLDKYGAVYLWTAEKGYYTFQIKNDKKVFFEKRILIEGKTGIKYNFTKLKGGNYTFSISKSGEKVFSKMVLKK